ncbi:peptidylprolyl isomerase [Telmatocola sphagniphila]|uniref:Peptidylprolyl isomerase n=1 Tax=Telmatocola sphagniphila TaxID=1123043 RepID=A0A8E6B9J5_9BACT|nr:peptidylprolyl isomerase [Telmatocola sphagniphila]QVL32885.1 peptidylprolyl isomerase [Telmatocola sphagniphila]
MKIIGKPVVLALSLVWSAGVVNAQGPAGGSPNGGIAIPAVGGAEVATPRPTGVAARVNNQNIPEVAVARALKAVPVEDRAKARPEIIQFLIDNALIDQYLGALKISVDAFEVEKKLAEFKAEATSHKQEYAKVLENLMLTEEELKEHIVGQTRFDKFVAQQATPEVLQQMFKANIDVFDGTLVRARHILVTPKDDSAKSKQEAEVRARQIKVALTKAVNEAMVKLPADTTKEAREQYRLKFTEDAFKQLAQSYSDCPSKSEGGDLNWFPRAGSMVEPFAKAAYALPAGTVSDIVPTQFGYHLILVTQRKQGAPTEFEKVKDAVRMYYEGKLREAITAKMRATAKIEVTPGR